MTTVFPPRLAVLAVLSVLTARPAHSQERPKQEDVQLESKTGTLFGTIDLPAGDGPWPVVLVLAGSGPTDRDGNQPKIVKTDCLKQLGQALAAKGVAVLRTDKRGIAKSAKALPKEDDIRFDVYVDDAVAWIEQLRKDRRFGRVGVVGHSEGSLIGMIAAKRVKADAFVSLAGAGRSAPVVLREQLGKNLTGELKEKGLKAIDDLEAGRAVTDVPKELASLFRPSVQPYLMSWFKYDPAKEIAGVEAPVLIVQGTTDVQVTMEDAKKLAEGRKGATLRVFDDMNHVLKKAATPEEQHKAYTDPAVPLMPKLADSVGDFLTEALKRPR
jgi:pimeloyl-ACP methyl ester carboxylesterase